jgi:pimeloyl-ACP methyl ester carboxylesterase
MLVRSSLAAAFAALLAAGCGGGGSAATTATSPAAPRGRLRRLPAPRPGGAPRVDRGAWPRRVVLVGASIGGRAVVTAAARAPGQVDAVVSLSDERILGAQRDLLLDARRLRGPTLWVSSANDGYTNFADETRQLYRGARTRAAGPPARRRRRRPRHRPAHGSQAREVVPAVSRFIRRG